MNVSVFVQWFFVGVFWCGLWFVWLFLRHFEFTIFHSHRDLALTGKTNWNEETMAKK